MKTKEKYEYEEKDGWLDNFLGLILNPILVNMEMDDGKKRRNFVCSSL